MKRDFPRSRFIASAIIVCACAVAVPALAATQLTGAGSTFVYPFFSKAFYTYSQAHQDVLGKLSVDRLRWRHPAVHR